MHPSASQCVSACVRFAVWCKHAAHDFLRIADVRSCVWAVCGLCVGCVCGVCVGCVWGVCGVCVGCVWGVCEVCVAVCGCVWLCVAVYY